MRLWSRGSELVYRGEGAVKGTVARMRGDSEEGGEGMGAWRIGRG